MVSPKLLVSVEREGHLACLWLDRPEQRNAVSREMLAQLEGALGRLATDPEVRVVVLGGRGPDFCAGADFADLTSVTADDAGVDFGRAFEDVLRAIGEHPSPVVARVHGSALGAGCQIVVACDLAVAAADARLGIPSSRLGIVVNYENIERLMLAVGPKRAAEVLCTGRIVSGAEASAWGLVNTSADAESLDERVDEMTRAIVDAAPLSVRGSKRGIRVALGNLSVDRFAEGHLVADFDMMAAQAFLSEDLQEGIRAFRERRKPRFTGR